MPKLENRSAGVPSELREKNLKTIIDVIFRYRAISRTKISQITGISKSTVSKLVGSLIEDELLVHGGKISLGLGKKQELLSLNPEKAFTVSIDVGLVTSIVTKVDFSMNIVQKLEIQTNTDPVEFAFELANCVRTLTKGVQKNPAYVVISLPGLVKSDLRVAINVPLLHWSEVALAELVEHQLASNGILSQVMINNDAKLGIIAEVSLNEDISEDYRNIVFILVKEGVGVGLYINGSLYVGSNHIAGEFGHMVVDPKGPQCSCGRTGCWLTVVGSRELDHYLRENSLDEYIELFSVGLLNIVNGLDPDLVIISGALENHWDKIFSVLKGKLVNNSLVDYSEVQLMKSAFGDREGPILGGALMGFKKFLDIDTGVV